MKFGHTDPEDTDAKARTEELCREFALRFRERNSSIVCRDLLECDISTEEGKAMAKEQGLSEKRCSGFVSDGAEILTDLLEL